MAKAKRVFEIAKDLGVASKAIVDKCQAESVPGVTNHMSTVKLGLEQTIRQWFSDSAVQEATAIEVADKVDLSQAKAKAKSRAKAKAKSKGSERDDLTESASGADTAVAEADEETEQSTAATTTSQAKARPRSAEADASDEQAEAAAQAAADAEEATQAEAEAAQRVAERQPVAESQQEAVADAAEAGDQEIAALDEDVASKGVLNVPDRPDIVKPAGQRLEKPQEAQLKGPRVVRVEQPEPERVARPRRGPGGPGRGPDGPGGPGSSMPPGTVDGIVRSRGPQRGRGVGGGGAAPDDSGPARSRRRSAQSARRSKQNTLPTGPGKYTEQDLIELENRIRTSSGFIKQRRRDNTKRGGGHQAATPVQVGGKVEIQEPITIKSLSATTGIKASDILRVLFKQGVMATINSGIDTETAMEIALEYEIELEVREQQTAEQKIVQGFQNRDPIDVHRRPPVVAVLGHVDHGKTSLLDRIRAEDVAAHEAGGITQHIGAYRVTMSGQGEQRDKTVVFLDTPGHEAFTSMRARGAHVTDIVVLVVAADDGVMPQTVESINHAKAAEVPVVVALNKIDRPEATDANMHKIYGQLAEHGLNPTEWGGETEIVKVSAITGQGVPDLLEILDYQAELLELTADYGGPARGTVIEAEMQEGRGPVARVLVEQGQMALGDFVVMGRAFGRVRDMTDDHGRHVEDAGPATPLELSGIDVIPDAGDHFYVTNSLKAAEDIAHHYRETERDRQLAQVNKVTLDTFHETLQAGQVKDLRVVLKADVQGSVDVLRDSVMKLGNDEVTVKVLHAAVGGITERDVLLADASDAVVLGFHVVASPVVRDLAEERGVEIRTYRIIYELLDDVTQSLEGMLTPEKREETLGEADVKEVFRISKLGNIAGCLVAEGSILRTSKMRVVRDGVVVTDQRDIESLRRVKDDVREVRVGTECGIRLKGFDDIKAGDRLICYNTIEIKRKLV